MTDDIGVPIMLIHFPVPIKAFYMKKDVSDERVTESVDCLVPGVGEVVGSGMRMDNYESLLAVMEENKWNCPRMLSTQIRESTELRLMADTEWESSDF